MPNRSTFICLGNTFNNHLIKINQWEATSQTCYDCGYVNKNIKNLSIRTWECPNCGILHDRDLNAAKNIERAGLALCNLT